MTTLPIEPLIAQVQPSEGEALSNRALATLLGVSESTVRRCKQSGIGDPYLADRMAVTATQSPAVTIWGDLFDTVADEYDAARGVPVFEDAIA